MTRVGLVLSAMLLSVLILTGCPHTTPELLASRKWASAREAARWRSGESTLAVDAWMREQSSLVVVGSAHDMKANWPGTEKATWPLVVHARFQLRTKDIRSMGFFKLMVRARGVLWSGKPHDEREWIATSTVWRVFGEGAKESPWALPPREPKDTLLMSIPTHGLVCSTHEVTKEFRELPRPGDDRCETDLLLIPSRFAVGPPALFATALVQWPDDEVDATTWRTIEFRAPLTERPTLAESVSAALGDGTTPQTLVATPSELSDLE